MGLRRQLARGLRGLVHSRAADQDVADEVRDYFERAAADRVAAGLSPDEARRAVRLELGDATAAREQVRESGWEHAVGALLADLRYAARRLRRSPGFAAVGALTLALGVGASTAIFSAVNVVLLESLPYPRADRIMMVWDRASDGSRLDVTFGTYREVADRSRSFDALGVMKPWQPTMTGAAQPERIDGQRVSASYFRVLGVPPALGRDFQESDDRAMGPRVVILGDGLWRRRFAADRTIIGRQITLDGDRHTVIGVMPSAFENVPSPSADIWAPLQYDASLPLQGREWGHHLRMVGRLRPGVGAERAGRELDAIARTPVPEFARAPWAALEGGLLVSSLQDDVTRGIRPALLAVLGAVMLVLAIACVNVTNLLLARGAQRRGEFAMRAALGADRTRLVRQLLTESLLLALIGGALGLVVAGLGVRALVALSPPELPRAGAIGVDGPVYAFAFALTTLVGLAIGTVPALDAARGDLQSGLRQGSRRTAGGRRGTRRALVVAEVGLALVLLVGAGLLLRSLQQLFAVSPGFDASRLLTMRVFVSGHRYDSDSARARFFAEALEAVRRVPGVAAAAFTSQLPLSGDFDKYGVELESALGGDPGDDQSALRYAVTPGYFETMRIPLRRGRLLDAHDAAGAPPVVLINESLAKRRFPGRDPTGERVHVGDTGTPWFTVVGVVGDVRQTSLAVSPADAVYVTPTQWHWVDNVQSLVLRAGCPRHPPALGGSMAGGCDAAALAPAVRQAIWSVDKDQPVVRVATMGQLLAASAAERRFALTLFEAFGLAALLLAATGIYGVLSGSVAERTREIGVRSALGASRASILALVAREGLTLSGLGIAIGLAGAAVASHAVATLLFGVSRLDPVTYLGVAALLLGVSAVACGLPAWRAARIDPSITLRAE